MNETLTIAVIAIDHEGVLGSRSKSSMFGPLIQCETLLRTNGLAVQLGNEPCDGVIVLSSQSDEPYDSGHSSQLTIEYSSASEHSVLVDGIPSFMKVDQQIYFPYIGGNALGAIDLFLRDIEKARGVLSLQLIQRLSIELEVLSGLGQNLLFLLEEAVARADAQRNEIAELTLLIDELRAEIALLRTQIQRPHTDKVHWASKSAALTILAISTLVQGVAALDSLRPRVEEAQAKCELIVEITAPID